MLDVLSGHGVVVEADGAGEPSADDDLSFEEIIEGKHDDVPEVCFYMKGGIDEVTEHHKRLIEEEAKKAG